MTCINVGEFVLIRKKKKDHLKTETHRFKNVVIFIQTILSFVLSRKILNILRNFIPHETVLCDDRDPSWFNNKIKSLIHEKI